MVHRISAQQKALDVGGNLNIMKVEQILMKFIIILLALAVLFPIMLLLFVKDKSLAGQIGDALGGTSAPLISISAILAVVATYYYQRRNDQKNVRRELISANFNFLKEELNNIDHIVKVTTKGQTEVKSNVGKDAIKYIIRALNNNEYKHVDVRELVTFQPILNVYKYLDLLIKEVQDDPILLKTDKGIIFNAVLTFLPKQSVCW